MYSNKKYAKIFISNGEEKYNKVQILGQEKILYIREQAAANGVQLNHKKKKKNCCKGVVTPKIMDTGMVLH